MASRHGQVAKVLSPNLCTQPSSPQWDLSKGNEDGLQQKMLTIEKGLKRRQACTLHTITKKPKYALLPVWFLKKACKGISQPRLDGDEWNEISLLQNLLPFSAFLLNTGWGGLNSQASRQDFQTRGGEGANRVRQSPIILGTPKGHFFLLAEHVGHFVQTLLLGSKPQKVYCFSGRRQKAGAPPPLLRMWGRLFF